MMFLKYLGSCVNEASLQKIGQMMGFLEVLRMSVWHMHVVPF